MVEAALVSWAFDGGDAGRRAEHEEGGVPARNRGALRIPRRAHGAERRAGLRQGHEQQEAQRQHQQQQ